MSQGINWANPVFDVKTSQNYLARLQEFLATQQPGGSAGINANGDSSNHKRKSPSTAGEVDTASAIKDRKHGASRSIDQATHSHAKEGSSERESPDIEGQGGSKGRAGKNTTSEKRKEQNRNAQRAFRERKEKVVRDLEEKVSELERSRQNTVSENQNLKEMISRLQEENAKLRSTSAPQSDFTFTVPSASQQTTAPAFSGTAIAGNNQSSSSLSTNDILSMLASAPAPAQPSQTPFTMINFSPPITSNTNPLTAANLDDWMNNWNSSAFGTELPQAVPPSVTNLSERPADSDFASLWNSLNQGSNPTFNTLQNQQAQQNAAETNNSFFSLFQNAFSPSLDGSSSASNPSFSQFANSSNNTASYDNNQNFSGNMFPFATNSANGSSATNSFSSNNINNGSFNQHQQQKSNSNRNTAPNSSAADSPETCASSTSGGSDPSDAQPSTPNNGQTLFGNDQSKANSKSGGSLQSFYPDIGLTSFNAGQGQAGAAGNGNGNVNNVRSSGFESATTPSGVFDTMSYRDPLMANLGGHSGSGSDFNFDSFITGSGVSPASGSNKRSDTLDFSDFLVASPPGMTQSPPVTGNLFQMPSNHGQNSNSSSSLPTLGSLSHGASPASTQPSPQTSLNTASSSTGASSANSTPNWLPYDVPYTHPLIQHVMKDRIQQDKANFESQMKAIPRNGPCDVDGLCDEMKMKATCKDHAMDRIAKSIQTDEMTMKLYNDYLASAGNLNGNTNGNNGNTGQFQQTPSPNLN